LYQHLREVLWTSIPAFAITLLVSSSWARRRLRRNREAREHPQDLRRLAGWHFLPLIIVVVLAALRLPPVHTIMMGALVRCRAGGRRLARTRDRLRCGSDLATPLALLQGRVARARER